MTKKDRVAVVATVFSGLLMCFMLTFSSSHPSNQNGEFGAFFVAVILACYWSYRFIQNDISFLKIKGD